MTNRSPPSLDFTRIPSIPIVLLNLIDACRRPEFGTEEVASIVVQDPGVCCRILATINKDHDAKLPHKSLLETAVSDLGAGGVKSIAIQAVAHQFFADPVITNRPCLPSLWRRSIACALRAEALAQFIDYPSPDEAYLAGLFHLLGHISSIAPADSVPAAEVAALMVEPWEPHVMMTDAIRYQGEPLERILDAHLLVKILSIACRLEGAKCQDDDPGYVAASMLLRIRRTELYDLLLKVEQKAKDTFLRIGLNSSDSHPFLVETVQLDLARQIRNFTMLSAAAKDLAEADDRTQILSAIIRQVGILFGLGRTLIFLFNAEENLLDALDSKKGESLAGSIRIRSIIDQSLVSDSFFRRKPLSSLQEKQQSPQVVVDRQLIRILGREGIACIPLISRGSRVGVIVSGIDSLQLGAFEKQVELLQDFGELAAAKFNPAEASGPTNTR